ncbi:CMD1 [Symbiodinium sp. KB8]|nr:CMD1 [Symbiodinium sp. KB8]
MAAAKTGAERFTEEERVAYRVVFDKYDADGSGAVDGAELKSVFAECGQQLTDEEVKDLMQEFDDDGNGELEFKEFLEMMSKLVAGPTTEQLLDEMFKLFDTNKDGFIDAGEMKAVMKEVGQTLTTAEAQAMLDEGSGGSGKVDKAVFAKLCADLIKLE